jgi:hypothetical protein
MTMTDTRRDYTGFLHAKTQWDNASGFMATYMPDFLFGFQYDLVDWAVQMGRSAIFADCGLGKTPMQLTWAENVRRKTGRPVLVITPLAVAAQTVTEAGKFGLDAAISRDGRPADAHMTVTNYDRLEMFNPDDYGGVVCDESSAIKAFDGKRRAIVTEFLRTHRYRLLCTATAAPNDYIELGTSSEALGYLGHMDMLGKFFVNDQKTAATNRFRGQGPNWRFKGHAEEGFWRWVSSWARAIRKPSDLGHDDTGYDLPDLIHREHVVNAPAEDRGDLLDGLVDQPVATGLHEERAEARRTITQRAEKVAELLADTDRAVAWCQLNPESALLTKLIDGAVEVTGSMSIDEKEERLAAFTRGEIRVLVTKPSIGAWGLNWQHCNRMTFFPSHSYEQYYQAVRRSWRFGQTRPVTVDIVTTPGGAGVLANLQRKADQADRMFDSLTAHMRAAITVARTDTYGQDVRVPTWLT